MCDECIVSGCVCVCVCLRSHSARGVQHVVEAVLCVCVCVSGPTVLEVFNTLLKQLRLSVDYEVTGCYDAYGSRTTTKEEERQLQEAVIKTIGEEELPISLSVSLFCTVF